MGAFGQLPQQPFNPYGPPGGQVPPPQQPPNPFGQAPMQVQQQPMMQQQPTPPQQQQVPMQQPGPGAAMQLGTPEYNHFTGEKISQYWQMYPEGRHKGTAAADLARENPGYPEANWKVRIQELVDAGSLAETDSKDMLEWLG